MTKLNLGSDVNGRTSYAPPPCELNYSATLISNTGTSITVPSEYATYTACFSYQPGADVWICFSSVDEASVPVGQNLTVTSSVLLPSSRVVVGGSTIQAITSSGPVDMGISLYAND